MKPWKIKTNALQSKLANQALNINTLAIKAELNTETIRIVMKQKCATGKTIGKIAAALECKVEDIAELIDD